MRTLNTIAQEISADWGNKISPYAAPYLEAMSDLQSVSDNFYSESGRSVVAYFLANAQTWRGEKAREIKKELNLMIK
mgnify:CR=1 FL=1